VKEKKSGKVEKKESRVLYDPVSDTYYELYNYPLVELRVALLVRYSPYWTSRALKKMSSAPKLPNAVRFSPTVRWANKYANMGSNANMYAAVVALTSFCP